MDQLAEDRATLLRVLKARECRLMFDWLVEQSYAIAATVNRSRPLTHFVIGPTITIT